MFVRINDSVDINVLHIESIQKWRVNYKDYALVRMNNGTTYTTNIPYENFRDGLKSKCRILYGFLSN